MDVSAFEGEARDIQGFRVGLPKIAEIIKQGDNIPHSGKIPVSRMRGDNFAAVPAEELHPKFSLQELNILAQRWLGNTEGSGGAGNRSTFRKGGNIPYGFKVTSFHKTIQS
jgi:hypothetical protein